MRYQQIAPKKTEVVAEETLNEVNMSPTNLKKLSSQIPASVGMEFEMVVPGLSDPDDQEYYEPEEDSDADESWPNRRGRWRRDVESWFRHGNNYESYGLRDALDEMDEGFSNWVANDYVPNEYNGQLADNFREKVRDNAPDGTSDEEIDEIIQGGDGDVFDQAMTDLVDELVDDDDTWQSFCSQSNIDYMSDFVREHNLTWPYMTEPEEMAGGSEEWEMVGSEFGRSIGRPVDVSTSYHGSTKSKKAYTMEPDGSIHGRYGETGAEFVSPPLTLAEMLEDLKNVVAWAQEHDCYTNNSTGLHINVSLPNYSLENLDYIKLALFIGDEHVSSSFGRLGASYARSAMEKIRDKITASPEVIPTAMNKIKEHLSLAASKLIHSGLTDKYTSINTKDNRVEFRSPGGDWLKDMKTDPNKIPNTIMRFMVGLDAALDTSKYKEEYAKKLYKLLAPEGDDVIKYFSQYSAGTMPASDLKRQLKKAQRDRMMKKGLPVPDIPELPGEEEVALNDGEVFGQGPNIYRVNYINGTNGQRGYLLIRGSSRWALPALPWVQRLSGTADVRITGVIDVEITNGGESQADTQAPNGGSALGHGPNVYRIQYVDRADNRGALMVRGDSRRSALDAFTQRFPTDLYRIEQVSDVEVTDDSAARASAASSGLYRITNDTGGEIGTVTADNAMDAYDQARRRLQAAGMENSSWRLLAPGGRQIYPDQATPGTNIWYLMRGNQRITSVNAADRDQALRAVVRLATNTDIDLTGTHLEQAVGAAR
jgi:hypothetical protein